MKAIIGLGNIGNEFDNTYHNVGFYIVDAFVKKNNIVSSPKKLKNSTAIETVFKGEKLVIAKPTTYMNNSGRAVLELMQKYKLKPSDIVVVFDDFDMLVGKVRYREHGSAGTHNGIRDIVACIGTNFKRVKMGIGVENRNRNFDLRYYVTSKISEENLEKINNNLSEAIEKIEQCLC